MKQHHFIQSLMTKSMFVVYLLFFLCMSCSAYAVTIQLNQTKIRLLLAPGETKTDSIVVLNPEEEPVSIKVYTMDWLYDPVGDGAKSFFEPGTQERSCSRWLHVYPEQVVVPPRGASEVKYTITVPEGSEGGHYSVVFFETELGTAQDQEGNYFKLGARMGALILQEDPQTVKRSGKITDFDVNYDPADESISISYTFQNTGNADIILKGDYNIVDSEGNLFGRGSVREIYTLPHGEGKTSATWEGILPVGDYTVMVTLDLGDDKIITREKHISIAKDIEVKEFAYRTAEDKEKKFIVSVKNISKEPLTLQGTIIVTGKTPEKTVSYSIDPFSVPQGELKTVQVPCAIQQGDAKAVLELRYLSKRVKQELAIHIE